MGNWAQLYADLTAQLQAGQALGFWDNAFVGFYQSFVAAGRWRLYLNGLLTTLEATILRCCWASCSASSSRSSARRTTSSAPGTRM